MIVIIQQRVSSKSFRLEKQFHPTSRAGENHNKYVFEQKLHAVHVHWRYWRCFKYITKSKTLSILNTVFINTSIRDIKNESILFHNFFSQINRIQKINVYHLSFSSYSAKFHFFTFWYMFVNFSKKGLLWFIREMRSCVGLMAKPTKKKVHNDL